MSPIKRKDTPVYYLDFRRTGYPRVRISTGTTSKKLANDMEGTLDDLCARGRGDLLGLIAQGRITMAEVHASWLKDAGSLSHLVARAESRALGPLVDEWLGWLPHGISDRTRKPYSAETVVRYRVSWAGFFAALPKGREATLTDLTDGFVEDYRATRQKAVGGRARYKAKRNDVAAGTMNRDLAALGAFLTWIEKKKKIQVKRPVIVRQREPSGRMVWLDSAALLAFETHCPPAWWPFFAVLFFTGARLGEVRGLYRQDVRFGQQNLLSVYPMSKTVVDGKEKHVKSDSSARPLAIPPKLAEALQAHLEDTPGHAIDWLFPGEFQDYGKIRRVWDDVCKASGITGATPHDARHTFGVHAAISGIPLPRLQKMLGHATPAMTLRYMQHSPQAYLADDAATIAASMTAPQEPAKLKLA